MDGSPEPNRANDAAEAIEVRAALERILARPEFAASPQLSAFLTYIVTVRLAGTHDRLKGYTIAIEALGRDASFDPQQDPIVRVEATRLRRALAAYYASPEGLADPLLIEVPRGSYVPVFSRRPPEAPPEPPAAASDASAAAPVAVPLTPATAPPTPKLDLPPSQTRLRIWQVSAVLMALCLVVVIALSRPTWLGFKDPVVAFNEELLPSVSVDFFSHSGAATGEQSATLAELIKSTLARFGQIRVVVGSGSPADYALRGLIAGQGDELTVTARLVHLRSGATVWSSTKREFLSGRGTETVIRGLVGEIATAVGQPYGVIHADLLTRLLNSSGTGSPRRFEQQYRCFLSAYEYWRTFDPAAHGAVRTCLEETVKRLPGLAAGHALLTYFYLDEYRLGYNPVPGSRALDRALLAAQTAVRLDPENATSLQALLGVLFVRRDFDESLRIGERVLVRNPYDMSILADVGSKLVVMGDIARGRELLARAAEFNPSPPAWHMFFLFLGAWLDDDSVQAARYGVRIQADNYVLGDVAKLLGASAMTQPEDLQASLFALNEDVEFVERPFEVLLRNIPSPDIAARLMADLGRAGFDPDRRRR